VQPSPTAFLAGGMGMAKHVLAILLAVWQFLQVTAYAYTTQITYTYTPQG